MVIKYSKDSLKFLSKLDNWDPDFTKVTSEEASRIANAENSGFIDDTEIDWDNLESFLQ